MDFQRITVEPVRFIPFDLGVSLNKNLLKQIKGILRKKFIVKELSQRQHTILSRKPIQFQIGLNLSLCLFETGIGVFIFHDEIEYYEDHLLFAVKYLEHRKKSHQSILNWEHPISSSIHTAIEEIKYICTKENLLQRPTARINNGLSYVMTIIFIHPQNQKKETLQYDLLPTYLQKGIPAILNPAFLGLNDSILLPQKLQFDQDYFTKLINSIEEIPHNYEQRKHIMTFMSWASVIILGNINDHDKEEYISLEIELQHYWKYINCMEKSLPEDLNQLKTEKIDLDQIINLKFEANLIE